MHVPARQLRTALRNVRALGALVLVLALLIYANVVALQDAGDQAFRSTAFLRDAELEGMLATRQTDLVRYALVEYGSLVLALSGATLLVAGPFLRRALRG
jgi:hypothetical protein